MVAVHAGIGYEKTTRITTQCGNTSGDGTIEGASGNTLATEWAGKEDSTSTKNSST